jgi:histone H3/H4
MTELPQALMARIIKSAGASRVSEDAKKALAEILEDVARETSKRAVSIASHSKRKTIKADDIRLALKEIWD